MAEAQRLHKPRAHSEPSQPAGHDTPAPAPARAPAAPAWAAAAPAAPFALGGVQRKVAIGPSNDSYEREADSVASRVSGGQRIASGSISSISPASLNPVGQRQAKPEQNKPEQSKKDESKKNGKPAAPVQREVRPEDKTKDAKASMPIQRAEKTSEKKKDETPPTVHRQSKPEQKPEQKKDDKKKDGAAPSAPVQRAANSPEASNDAKKKDEKPSAIPVQRAAKPEEKKPEEKKNADKPAPVQRNVRPEDQKKIERDTSAPIQMQSKPQEKKPDDKNKTEKPAAPTMQRAAKPEEKKPDDKSAAPVQRESKSDDKKKDDKPAPPPVQRMDSDSVKSEPAKSDHEPHQGSDHAVQTSKSAGPAAPAPSMEAAASNAIASKGPGEPLHSPTRNTLESGLGSDLSDVRVHHDSAAHSAAESLNARAFTHQSDIWLGRGESQHNLPLMAHEATHVLQQTGSVHRQLIQRAPDKSAGGASKSVAVPASPGGDSLYSGPEGEVKKGQLIIPKLQIPTFKLDATKDELPLKLPRKTDEPRPDDQRQVWEKEAKSGTGIDTKLEKKLKEENAPSTTKGGLPIYFSKLKSANVYVLGNTTTIKNRSLRPYWDKNGQPLFFDVDHKKELQLGGANDTKNMWLLESEANRSSGRNIRAEKNSRIQKLLIAAVGKAWDKPPDIETVRRDNDIFFKEVVGGLPVEGQPAKRWTLEEIRDDARQIDELKFLSKKEIEARGLQGSPCQIVIYTNEAGGGIRISKGWKENQTEKTEKFMFGKMFQTDLITYDKNTKKGSLHGYAFKDHKLIQQAEFTFPLQESEAVDYGGYIPTGSVTKEIQSKLKLLGLSPIELGAAEFTDKGLIARGQVLPTVPLFKNLGIDLVIDGDNIYLSKVFSAGDFNFPGPIHVPSASLELFAGTQGIGARGDVFIEIDRVGKGKITGKAVMSEGFSIAGDFDFDTNLFDPAKIHVEYSKGKFSGSGKIGIPAGKVRGIKSASLEASFDDDKIDAHGSIIPDIPVVEQADLTLHYSKEDGLVIAGDLQLKKDIPGIEGGSIHAQVAKKPGSDRFTISATGEATPKIPGINSKLLVTYDDGAFDATITAAYEKGMLKGSVTVGATNRPVGDDGKPGPPPKEQSSKIIVYGGGSVTLKLAPWLQATAAIKFKPNGEVEVTGEIGLPSTINLFEEKKVEKNLFKIGIDIPIIGFSVLGQHVGIFLNIGGGLDLDAGIGPGQLQDVHLSVTYNPAHEEDTQVHGHAALHIPAHAGLRLSVHAALGAGIPLVDAEAGIELGGTLGIEGAAHADVDVDWTPKKGLVLDASAAIYAEPKFKFDITGFVLVELDLLFTTKTLYEQRWKLAAFEYGSGLRLGLKMPIHYEEGKPFSVSLSDIQFEVPNIDPMATLKGLLDKII